MQTKNVIISGRKQFQDAFGVSPKVCDSLIDAGMPAFQMKAGGEWHFPVTECKEWILRRFCDSSTMRTIRELRTT